MEMWLERNWWWVVALGAGAAYLVLSIIPRDASESSRIAKLNPFLDAKSWTPRAVLLAAVMIIVAIVGVVFFPGGRR
jgi:hypothetical protein